MNARLSFVSVALAAVLCSAGRARSDPLPVGCARDLRRMAPCELNVLFSAGKACEVPLGKTRGRVLYNLEACCPRLRAGLESALWKGKVFYPCGDFINRWCGFNAVTAKAEMGTSWFDGQPCIVLVYPPDAAVFSNVRDELREVAPGLYLGLVYNLCPCPKLRGYFMLEKTCCE